MPQPTIVETAAPVGLVLASCLGFALFFVASLYLFVPAEVQKLEYFDTNQIKARLKAVTVASVVSLAYCFFLLHRYGAPPFELMGFKLQGLAQACVLPSLLTMTLFAAPLYERLVDRQQRHAYRRRTQEAGTGSVSSKVSCATEMFQEIKEHLSLWTNLRPLVFAPLHEELVFRGCICSMLLLGGYRAGQVVLISPLFFGISHLHHFYRLVAHEQVPLGRALLQVVVQMTYTSLFGAYAAFVLCRTGHLLPAILQHMFCNFMGLPSLEYLSPHSFLYDKRNTMTALYVGGIALFVIGLFPVTQPWIYGSRLWEA